MMRNNNIGSLGLPEDLPKRTEKPLDFAKKEIILLSKPRTLHAIENRIAQLQDLPETNKVALGKAKQLFLSLSDTSNSNEEKLYCDHIDSILHDINDSRLSKNVDNLKKDIQDNMYCIRLITKYKDTKYAIAIKNYVEDYIKNNKMKPNVMLIHSLMYNYAENFEESYALLKKYKVIPNEVILNRLCVLATDLKETSLIVSEYKTIMDSRSKNLLGEKIKNLLGAKNENKSEKSSNRPSFSKKKPSQKDISDEIQREFNRLSISSN